MILKCIYCCLINIVYRIVYYTSLKVCWLASVSGLNNKITSLIFLNRWSYFKIYSLFISWYTIDIVWLNYEGFLDILFTRRKLRILSGKVWKLSKSYWFSHNISRHNNFRFVLISWVSFIDVKRIRKDSIILVNLLRFFIIDILWSDLTIGSRQDSRLLGISIKRIHEIEE